MTLRSFTGTKYLAGAVASLMLLLALGTASMASAASPWWHLRFEGRPADVQPGAAKDSVQEVTVRAVGGGFSLESFQIYGETEGLGVWYEEFNFNASDRELSEGLERMFGPGTVEVTGGPGDATGSKPYVIKFVGSRADQPVETMTAEASALGAQASVTQPSEGRSDGQIVIVASNLGDESARGEITPITIADKLPAGLTPVKVEAVQPGEFPGRPFVADCVQPAGPCTWNGTVRPYNDLEMVVFANATAGAKSGEVDEATVSGGGASGALRRQPLMLSSAPFEFGVQKYEVRAEADGGALDTQAGSHPFQLTTTVSLNQQPNALEASALVKDVSVQLPPGLVGNPTPIPQCTAVLFEDNECQANTAIGVSATKVGFNALGPEVNTAVKPVFNLVPSAGEPARFGFLIHGVDVFLDTSIRTGGDYGVTVNVKNIPQQAVLLASQVTIWGVPGDPSHDNARGEGCVNPFGKCVPLGQTSPPPFLSLPTSCTGPLQSSAQADSWAEPGVFDSIAPSEPTEALDGCNRLPFNPTIDVASDGQQGSTPTGLNVGIHVPQDLVLNSTALAESNVKDTTVTLPAGVTLNPAAADGLQACSEAQVALSVHSVPTCPDASKVATVSIKTPLLPNALTGAVYLAEQDKNPFGSLVALYLVAQDPVSGTLVKLAGEVKPDLVTGQLVSTFKNTPQLPFEDLQLHFFGGDRAPLATPGLCGTYTTTASIAAWSGNPPSEPSSSFQITSGPNGSACSNPLPFAPSLTAGTTSIQAGGFSPFTMTMSREDGQQNLKSVQLHMPPGLLGTLASVKLCGEVQANAGTCGPESLIGHTIVSVGLGGDPFSVTGGEVFITGPYEGAPYGLSIVNPAKAGPFDLGKVIVRAKIEVDPRTAALTVSTDQDGPYAIPRILDGIPLQIKHVNVSIDRPGFTVNPTNCGKLQITGSLGSDRGSSSSVAIPFQVTNCATLAFKPKFAVSTSGKTSRANGASLHVKLTYPSGPYDANIARVKVDLPKQLPSRLTTLQKACPAQTFEANPAACPAASIVGHAVAKTPVLPVPLSGPAYFVSHGGEAFPSLIVVLQGYGTSVQLVGTTFINKAGITSSTFKTVPDVPVGTFELTLPQGKDSALAANGNLCASKLTMPTAFTAQNGATIKQNTPISVTGCAKKKAKRAGKQHKGSAHGKK
jgi:hypothetical protein